MEVVVKHPGSEFGGAVFRAWVDERIGPLAQQGLDEPFCLAVGARRVGAIPGQLKTRGKVASRLARMGEEKR